MELLGDENLKLKIEVLFNIIEDETGATKSEMKAANRKKNIVNARTMFWAILKRYTKLGCVKMGKYLRKDHASVLHHLRKHKDLIAIYSEYSHKYTRIYKRTEALFITRTIFSEEYYKEEIRLLENQKEIIEDRIKERKYKIFQIQNQKIT